jgi:hypothetical protein
MSVIFFFPRSSHSLVFHNSKRQKKKKTPFVQARQCIYCGPYTFRQANIAHLHRLLLGLVGIARPWVKRSSQRAWAAELSPRNYGLQAPAHTHVGRERIGNFSVRTHARTRTTANNIPVRPCVRTWPANQPKPRSHRRGPRRRQQQRVAGTTEPAPPGPHQLISVSLSLSLSLFFYLSSPRRRREQTGRLSARRPRAVLELEYPSCV